MGNSKFIKTIKQHSIIFVLIIAITVSVGAVLMGYFYTNNMKKSLWSQIVTDITEVTAQGGHNFDTFIQGERDSLDLLAKNLSEYDSDDPEAMWLFNKHIGESGFYSLVIYGEGDKVTTYLAGTNEPVEGSKSSYESYGESGISEPYINNYTGQRTLSYYKRFTFKDGVEAIVRRGQLISYINKEFSLSFYNNAGFSYIVKNNGDIIVRSTHRNSNRTGVNIINILKNDHESSKEADMLEEALKEGKTGAMLSVEGSENQVISFVPLNEIEDWYIISIIPNSAVSQHVEAVLNSSMVFTVIMIVIMVIFILFVLISVVSRRRVMEKEAEVKHREQLFGILANNTNDVFVLLTHGKTATEYISPNVTRVMGFKESDIKDDIRLIGKPENAEKDGYVGYQRLNELHTGQMLVYENSERIHKITGETRYFREVVYCASIDGVDKDIIVFSDRTEDRSAEIALTNAMETAKAANKAKSEFLSNMSHDIRTPMNAILGFTELIKRDANDPAKVLQHLGKINASGQHLLGLINDILDMSKIESGKTVLNVQSFNLSNFITELDAIIRPQSKVKNQTFEIVTHEIKDEDLLGDKLRINQVLINILSNAVKYTPENGKIVLDVSELPRINENFARIRFTITDNGIGMSEEYLKVIFNPFTRENNNSTGNVQGTGLGMAITKNLVNLLGGVIDVKSEIGKGSTFTVELELRIDIADLNNKFWSKYGISHALIIDDEKEICTYVKDCLEEAGLKTDFVLSGEEAIELVQKEVEENNAFNLVVIDLKMQGINGIETAKKLREMLSSTVSIFMLTSYDWTEIEHEARSAGIDAFLPKPFFVSNLKLNIIELFKEKDALGKIEEKDIFKGKHILAAEDNILNAEILTELLDMQGVTCDLVNNGKRAVEKFNSSAPGEYDFILMDIQMPIMNGYDATREIRMGSHPNAKTIPIIAMTANAFAEDINAAIVAGMDAHVAKPMNMKTLEEAYRRILKNRNDEK